MGGVHIATTKSYFLMFYMMALFPFKFKYYSLLYLHQTKLN